MIAVQQAKKQDFGEIAKMIAREFPYAKASAENVSSRAERKEIALFKAVSGKKIVGFIELEMLAPFVWRLNGISVKKSERSKGIGTELMDFAISFLKGARAREIRLIVWQQNKKAKNLYLQYGFESTKLLEKPVWGKPAEEMVLRLEKGLLSGAS